MAHLGIDPGTKNIGVAVTSDTGKLLYGQIWSLDENRAEGMLTLAGRVRYLCGEFKVTTAAIERFVAFKGIHSKASEDILMLIGCLWYAIKTFNQPEIKLYRSIEWKPALCRFLVKETQFDNPSQKFDKVFSKAAATQITKEKITNDHLADAIGLSRMWILR